MTRYTQRILAPSADAVWKGAVQQSIVLSIHTVDGSIIPATTRPELVRELGVGPLLRAQLYFWKPVADPGGCKVLELKDRKFLFIPYGDISAVFCYNVLAGEKKTHVGSMKDCMGAYVMTETGDIDYTGFGKEDINHTLYVLPDAALDQKTLS